MHDEHSLKAQIAPPLSDLCVQVIAENFASRPTLRGIPMRYINRVTELLPTSLPLEVTGPLIDDEGYWKRCALQRWDNCQIVDHGSSWKRLYFERNLTDFLEVAPRAPAARRVPAAETGRSGLAGWAGDGLARTPASIDRRLWLAGRHGPFAHLALNIPTLPCGRSCSTRRRWTRRICRGRWR